MADECLFEVNPFDLSSPLEQRNFVNLNYTNQDFWSLKTRLVNLINQEFAEQFSDFVESSLAIMLIENWSFIADTLSFKIDQIANEIFIDTVTEIENAFRLSNFVGFEPQPPIAARSFWSATTSQAVSIDVALSTPLGIQIGTDDGLIDIELFPVDSENNPIFDEDIILPAGSTELINIIGLEGITTNAVFEGDGTVLQSYTVPGPVIYDSISVAVDGVMWSRVDYFTDSQPRREYRVAFDSDYNAYVMFGNNRAGFIPSPGSEILVTYRSGGGTIGNITTGSVVAQRTVNINIPPFTVPFVLTNYTRGQFGYNGDGLEEIRRKLPQYVRTQDRCVTGLDYKTLSDQYASAYHGQVGKTVAALREYGCAANIIDIYALAREGENGLAEMSNELKEELQDYINTKKMESDDVYVRDGTIIEVDTSIDVTVSRTKKKFEEEIREKITRRINLFFNLNYWEYNDDLKDTSIIKALSDIQEIEDFNIEFVTDNPENGGSMVSTEFNQIIRPDTTTISFTYR